MLGIVCQYRTFVNTKIKHFPYKLRKVFVFKRYKIKQSANRHQRQRLRLILQAVVAVRPLRLFGNILSSKIRLTEY